MSLGCEVSHVVLIIILSFCRASTAIPQSKNHAKCFATLLNYSLLLKQFTGRVASIWDVPGVDVGDTPWNRQIGQTGLWCDVTFFHYDSIVFLKYAVHDIALWRFPHTVCGDTMWCSDVRFCHIQIVLPLYLHFKCNHKTHV